MTTPPEVAAVTHLIDHDRVIRYSAAARDPNPIHTDAAVAATTEIGRPVAHGMLVLALVSEAMSATFGQRWAESGALKVRWRAPAIQPVEVTATAAPRSVEDGVASYNVQCETPDGTVLLTGTASVRVAES